MSFSSHSCVIDDEKGGTVCRSNNAGAEIEAYIAGNDRHQLRVGIARPLLEAEIPGHCDPKECEVNTRSIHLKIGTDRGINIDRTTQNTHGFIHYARSRVDDYRKTASQAGEIRILLALVKYVVFAL